MTEITASKRAEQRYDTLERICVINDRYIFLYTSSMTAYLLPVPQISAQASKADFLAFLSRKCNTAEYYQEN